MNLACNRYDDNLPILFVDFNQDFTSIQVGTKSGYSLLSTLGEQISETFSSSEPMCIVGRLFNRSLVTLVSQNDMRRLLVAHSRINTLICHYRYTLTILAVKMNHKRLVVCVEDGIFIHNMRDMQLLHKVEETPPNRNGVIALSANEGTCYLAYPGSHRVGTVFIFDALNFKNVTSIAAHDGLLAALSFNSRANLLATASEKGTVIRVFSIPQGDKIVEFRRGLTRCVNICSLSFSMNSQFLVAASHTETVHIFKLETRPSDKYPDTQTDYHPYSRHRTISTSSRTSQSSGLCPADDNELGSCDEPMNPYSSAYNDPNLSGLEGPSMGAAATMASWSHGLMGWMGNTLKSYSVYLPQQVSEIFVQDRAFAYARLPCSNVQTVGVGGQISPNLTGKYGCSGGGPDMVGASYPSNIQPTSSNANVNQPALGQRKVAALIFYQNQPRLIVASLDGFVHIFSINTANGGEATLVRTQRLLLPQSTSGPASSKSIFDTTLRTEINVSTPPLNPIGSGSPQQPGVYALPASLIPSKANNTYATVVAAGVKDEYSKKSVNHVDTQ